MPRSVSRELQKSRLVDAAFDSCGREALVGAREFEGIWHMEPIEECVAIERDKIWREGTMD